MFGGLGLARLACALVALGAVSVGCGKSGSDARDDGETGGEATSGSGGSAAVAGRGSGGATAGSGLVGTAGASTGGSLTCPTGGSAGASGGGQAGDEGDPTCGLLLYTPRIYAPECQAWLDENCCSLQRACGASPLCKGVVDCFNACDPVTSGCLDCCAVRFGVFQEAPAELEALAGCTKTGAVMPEGCDWPRTER